MLYSRNELRTAITALNAPPDSLTGMLALIFEQLEAMADNISSDELIVAAGFPNTQEEDAADMYQKLINNIFIYASRDKETHQRFIDLLLWQSSYGITCTVHAPSQSKDLHDSGNLIIIPAEGSKTLLAAIQEFKRKPDSDWR